MMDKKQSNWLTFLVPVLAAAVLLTSCSSPVSSGSSDNGETSGQESEETLEETSEEMSDDISEISQETTSSSERSSEQTSGYVDTISYTISYEGTSYEKTASVYVPSSYQESVPMNILYLLHGSQGSSSQMAQTLAPLLDEWIREGEIAPMLVVFPTYYPDRSFVVADYSQDYPLNHFFAREEITELMKAVESRFTTYAESADEEGFIQSRLHRAFGGYSMGGVTTRDVLAAHADLFAYFLPMAGDCWLSRISSGDVDDLLMAGLENGGYSSDDFRIVAMVGSSDSTRASMIAQIETLRQNHPDLITEENLIYWENEGGGHNMESLKLELEHGSAYLWTLENSQEGPFTEETSIEEVKNDPVLEGHGRLLFPVQEAYMRGDTLGELSLTWYHNIDPQTTVEIVNYLHGKAASGEQVFYDIYSEEEKQEDPAKEDTGLFFFRGEENARTAVVNAGGGFVYVGAMQDSFPVALELSKRGYNAFALIYRPGSQTACEDLARAIAFLFENEETLGISMDDYSLWGGSAGARMADWVGTYGTSVFGEEDYPQPAMVVTQYTGLSEVTGEEPPTYANVGTADYIADYRTMEERIEQIRENGTPAQIDVFEGLSHGFGLGIGTVAEGWIDHAVSFWQEQMADSR